jgi:7-cyano-7-deazaguanine synthase in queuosine biosynthesis
MSRNVLLFSGGVDSFIAYHYLEIEGIDVFPLYINYDGRYCKKEYAAVKSLISGVSIDWSTLRLSHLEKGSKAFIKNRNAYLALVASNYAKNIAIAGMGDDNVGDKTPEAFKAMETLLTTINPGETYKVYSPFFRREKIDILEWYLENIGDVDSLLKTVSCYSPNETFCGICPACFRKFCAFSYVDIHVPEFRNKALVKRYLADVDDGKYSNKRAASIRIAARRLNL